MYIDDYPNINKDLSIIKFMIKFLRNYPTFASITFFWILHMPKIIQDIHTAYVNTSTHNNSFEKRRRKGPEDKKGTVKPMLDVTGSDGSARKMPE